MVRLSFSFRKKLLKGGNALFEAVDLANAHGRLLVVLRYFYKLHRPDIRITLVEYVDPSLSVLINIIHFDRATPTSKDHNTRPLTVVNSIVLKNKGLMSYLHEPFTH